MPGHDHLFLFIVFMNDLPNALAYCGISLYADETVIYYSSNSIVELEHNLNSDLVNVYRWITNNHLTFNKLNLSLWL